MATASFDPLHFLMKISPDLLSRYAKHHGIDFKTKEKEAGEQVAEEFMKMLEQESEDKRAAFWLDTCDIDEIGTGNGCDYILNRAVEQGFNINEEDYQKLRNSKERAMYFYLNFYELFCETYDEYGIENMQGWRSEKAASKDIDKILVNVADFENGLKALYGKEYKGKNLKVKYLRKTERIIFTAYVEDAFTNDMSFKKGNLNPKTPRKPVFMAYFLYVPKEQLLEVKAHGGAKKIQELQAAFIRLMLKEEPAITNNVRYDFERVRNINALYFPTQATDFVESVTLKGLRLIHNSTKTSLIIDIGNTSRSGTEPIIESLKAMNIDLLDYRITQFKIKVVFKSQGKGRKRKVTTAITYPNICDLKEREIDIIVYQLLRRWGLDLF
ncbi:MAG: hypothetical protein AAB588_05180 [Patescibacteria group bacterium]